MTGTLCEAVAGELPRITDRLIAAVRASSAQHWATRFLADLENATC
jgi:hypothetical protein